ncbi:MAG TPA: 16S rRNA (adenine(1518)-N(6)/adenine(1519)-N(6))-dimethyltransferase RsmA [Candidatus Saccharimonadales bacterium]|nr:16S rRNA (adenine(1518)-N(6)/adenine(1519)-N(6))-dimethyltransferase RsmA [Candidatus Saccharimonadales bacterium]
MNISPKKSLGQHWLTDRPILDSICELADVRPGNNVLEVGPGKGTLTSALLDKGALVTAVEFDETLATELPHRIKSENLKVFNRDILKFDLRQLPADYKVVANIPYYLTSNLIRILSESRNPASSITLLVQKEVAERICAAPGAMSLLSVSAQVYYECSLGPVVPAEKFIPPPKVDSQVVHMVRRSEPLIADKDNKTFFRLVKAGFASRRKTLENSLAGGLGLSKQEVREILAAAGTDAQQRPQELSLPQWGELLKEINLTR